VTEVALTAQFQSPVVDLGILGAFAAKVEGQFPTQDQRPPAEVIQPETFNQAPGPLPFRIEQLNQVQLPRVWFISKDNERLIQLQADRISVNWRSMSGDPTKYPRYSKLRDIFKRQLATLIEIAEKRERLAQVIACEVLYVNPVSPPGRTEPGTHPDLATIINRLRRPPRGAFLGKPEDSQWQARWRIPSENNGEPAGRLHVYAAPALSEDQRPIYVIQMNGRTTPASPDSKGALDALDLGHKWVVKGFEDITTNKMHQIWERGSS
jgi:uncharacterized protein (TIGR04255 family)